MANLKDIRGRISSVKNIRKITRAMEMISDARLRRAEQRIEHLRPYADALRRMTSRAGSEARLIDGKIAAHNTSRREGPGPVPAAQTLRPGLHPVHGSTEGTRRLGGQSRPFP